MSLIINEEEKIFTLHTRNTSYQMMADRFGFLLHLYYGPRAEGRFDYLLPFGDRGFSGNPYEAGERKDYSLDSLPQEYPVRGSGDFRSPALDLVNADGTYGCDLRFAGYRIEKGKYALAGLPAVYAEPEEAETLKIYLEDRVSGVRVTLLYGVLEELDVITRAVQVENISGQDIRLTRVLSASMDFLCGNYDVVSFAGRHAGERLMKRHPVPMGEFSIGSRRGTSSHQFNPLMILADHDANEDHGFACAMEFVYSGGFMAQAGMDQYKSTRFAMGLADDRFDWKLSRGEVFTAPEVIMTLSSEGFAKLSRNLHDCIRQHLCRGKYKDQLRPVLINSWEAFYMDFTGDKILGLAREAKELGIDLLVLDDGWFGERNDDCRALGDWYVNTDKLGCTLPELVEKVNAIGMKFGIWVEPEMVNEDSALYREHPDWAMVLPGRKPVRGRHQLVLDFSRAEVVDAIYDRISEVLSSCRIEYLKWDMNRSIADVYSATAGAEDQGKVLYRYVLGLYDFLERLNRRYPDLLIEGCSGGGGRFDAGMLYYCPQIWCSDNTDPIDRTRIQYGTSFGYPLCTMGAHVSASPNHADGRTSPVSVRSTVAMAGTFGYELDLSELSAEDKAQIRKDIETFRGSAALILSGDYYRLSNPFDGKLAAWETVSRDQSEVLVSAVRLDTHDNPDIYYVRLRGLAPGASYMDRETGMTYSADALMYGGLPVPPVRNDSSALMVHLFRETQ